MKILDCRCWKNSDGLNYELRLRTDGMGECYLGAVLCHELLAELRAMPDPRAMLRRQLAALIAGRAWSDRAVVAEALDTFAREARCVEARLPGERRWAL